MQFKDDLVNALIAKADSYSVVIDNEEAQKIFGNIIRMRQVDTAELTVIDKAARKIWTDKVNSVDNPPPP